MKNKPKKTLVIGASPKPDRYANKAILMLGEYGHEIVALGKRPARVNGIYIQTTFPENESIHTVTLYVGAKHQQEYYDRIQKLKPRRVIFNPGSENDELKEKLESSGIETVTGCTLVMLRSGQF